MTVQGAENAGATGGEAKERRANGGQRVQFEALVSIGEEKGGFEAESVNVSPDGMRLRTAYVPEVGTKLVCRFDSGGTEVVAEGEVAWRTEQGRGGEFGLRFVDLDDKALAAVRSMCAALSDEPEAPSDEKPQVGRGTRVRLHIDGLGAPMKARVRDSAGQELSVGSNLEFLKVGKTLELEDVEQGNKRGAHIADVKVDVDPASHVPQLVVMLRYGAQAEKPAEARSRASVPQVGKEAAKEAPVAATAESPRSEKSKARSETVRSKGVEEAPATRASDAAEGGAADILPALSQRASQVGKLVANTLGPTLSTVGTRAKDAMGGVLAAIHRRSANAEGAAKTRAPRRTTAPPPGGAITNSGRKLVREEGMQDEEETATPRNNRRAAVMGGALGLAAVLAIFAGTRLLGSGSKAQVSADHGAVAALSASAEGANPVPGTPIASVPLFGATPLSTTEPLAPPATSVAGALPDAGAQPTVAAGADEAKGPILREWGQGSVQHPVVLRIKTDGAIERLTGSAGAQGFTLTLPGRRSLSNAHELTRKDKRLASVDVVNTSRGAEVTVQFKDGVPPYLAKIKGDKLEIAIGKEGHSKVAKSHKKGKHH